MCGIVGYIGKRDAGPILMEGLHRLEYRGYDSAGIACARNNKLSVHKAKGKVRELERQLPAQLKGTPGIAHTRWATHGEPRHSATWRSVLGLLLIRTQISTLATRRSSVAVAV